VCEGEGKMPDSDAVFRYNCILGFDPIKKKFVGTWVGSMMTHLFTYEGVLDKAGVSLPLDTMGPDFADPAKLAHYQDIYEMHKDGRRELWSQTKSPDGTWMKFMSCDYTRV
jgi:hypothetical protein